MIHGIEHIKCEVDFDAEEGGWITVIVPGPCEIPARAKISLRIVADIAMPKWLGELRDSSDKIKAGLDRLADALDEIEAKLL